MGAADFKRASQAVWEAMAPGWDERHAYFEEMARSVTERMLERLQPSPGETILDLAAGTGIVGFAAARLTGPSGKVIVSDFAETMVEIASRRAKELGLENVGSSSQTPRIGRGASARPSALLTRLLHRQSMGALTGRVSLSRPPLSQSPELSSASRSSKLR